MRAIDVLKYLLAKAESEVPEGHQIVGLNVPVDIVREIIGAQPEIIKCKDCKWKNRHNCTRAVEVIIDDDKYCAWAERREE